MSIVTYNGITLPYANHTEFRQEAVYDQHGQTDRMLTRTVITVQAMINANYLALLAPNLLGKNDEPLTNNPADIMVFIRNTLLQPRKHLSYSFDGRELLPATVAGNRGNVDAKNGPKPLSCNYIQLTNTTFLIDFSIEAHYWENNEFKNGVLQGNNPSNVVISNRWKESVDIDVNLYSTYTREGSYTIRSDNNRGLTADQVRIDMVPAFVRKGFLRVQELSELSHDGLTVDYRIVEREVFRMPPTPATEAKGWFKARLTKQGSYALFESFCSLKAPKDQEQSTLIGAAIYECFHRLRLNGVRVLPEETGQDKGPTAGQVKILPRNATIVDMTVTTEMYENAVQVHLVVQPIKGPDKSNNFGILNINELGEGSTGRYEPKITYPLRGTAEIQMQAAAYYDPNNTKFSIIKSDNPETPVYNRKSDRTIDSTEAANFNSGKLPGQEGKQGPAK